MAKRKRTRFGRVRRIGRRMRGFRRGKDRRLSLLKTGAIVGIEADAFMKCGGIDGLQANPGLFVQGFIDQNLQKFTGFSVFPGMSGLTGWHPEMMLPTYGSIIAASIGSSLATRFGVNREMKKIPFVGKYIKL